MSKVNTSNPSVESCKDGALGDFSGGPVVKAPPSNAGDTGSIPGRGIKIPHASGQRSPQALKQPMNPFATTKTQCSQIYINNLKKKRDGALGTAAREFRRNKSPAAATAAKSLQSCPTLCDPIDGSPTGSPVPGILQARTLEWVAISFSNA